MSISIAGFGLRKEWGLLVKMLRSRGMIYCSLLAYARMGVRE